MKTDLLTLVELAKEIGLADSIDFGYLDIDDDTAYNVVAMGVLEKHKSTPDEMKESILLASCIHLVVENMVLNMKLLHRNTN